MGVIFKAPGNILAVPTWNNYIVEQLIGFQTTQPDRIITDIGFNCGVLRWGWIEKGFTGYGSTGSGGKYQAYISEHNGHRLWAYGNS